MRATIHATHRGPVKISGNFDYAQNQVGYGRRGNICTIGCVTLVTDATEKIMCVNSVFCYSIAWTLPLC